MRLDLGGIAKGYACDEAIRVLKKYGIGSAMVEMGGDIVVSGPPPGADGWMIDVPNADVTWRRRTLCNAAVSSSGDTEQYIEIDGRRYSHIVDPRTGVGLTDRIGVTVIARDGITSDGLSTAISVLGLTEGQSLAKTYGVTAYIRCASEFGEAKARRDGEGD
jgi:thiamine biosynthesis lipoprotein